MTDGKQRPALTPKAEAAKAEREARLAAALRENLRKRKSQERAAGRATEADGKPAKE